MVICHRNTDDNLDYGAVNGFATLINQPPDADVDHLG